MSVFVLVGSSANAADGDYADPTLDVSIDVQVCDGGPVRFSGQSSIAGDWTVTLDGETRTGSGTTFSTTFPVVGVNGASAPASAGAADATYALASTSARTLPSILAPGESGTLTATLEYVDQSGATASVTRTANVAIPICEGGSDSIADADTDGGLLGVLPGTGGAALWIFVLAVVLIAVGATITRIARRRA